MSTFNTRKDRDRNGKAKPHKHSGIPTLTGKWRHPSMECWVNYSTPGDDPQGIVWFPDCYPQIYYY
ncbi:hypothetical protein ACVW6E_004023 [Escherichia coli]